MRWFVGDVQGCARELDTLVSRIGFDPGRDELWSAGDLVNRGPDSAAALRLWRDVGGYGVLGNHDLYALLAWSGRWPRKKKDTLDDLFGAPDAGDLLERVRKQPVLVRFPGADGARDVWLVHAGLDPRVDDLQSASRELNAGDHDDDWLLRPELSFAVRVRCCTAEGELSEDTGPPSACRPPFAPWDSYYRGDALVVHGHWAARGHYRGERTLGLDSGCVYGGKLTAWCQQEDRIVQVASRSS